MFIYVGKPFSTTLGYMKGFGFLKVIKIHFRVESEVTFIKKKMKEISLTCFFNAI
jgi:hypothetical protein